jgi:hypothetical protein
MVKVAEIERKRLDDKKSEAKEIAQKVAFFNFSP